VVNTSDYSTGVANLIEYEGGGDNSHMDNDFMRLANLEVDHNRYLTDLPKYKTFLFLSYKEYVAGRAWT